MLDLFMCYFKISVIRYSVSFPVKVYEKHRHECKENSQPSESFFLILFHPQNVTRRGMERCLFFSFPLSPLYCCLLPLSLQVCNNGCTNSTHARELTYGLFRIYNTLRTWVIRGGKKYRTHGVTRNGTNEEENTPFSHPIALSRLWRQNISSEAWFPRPTPKSTMYVDMWIII